jgi:hypothetical protein
MIKKPYFSEFATDKQEEQGLEFRQQLGSFVIAFERMCEAMQVVIVTVLKVQGLTNDSMAHVLVGDLTSSPLQKLLGGVYSHLDGQSEQDRCAVKDLLKEIASITERRNEVLHSVWRFPTSVFEDDIEPVGSKMHVSGKNGADLKHFQYSAADLETFVNDAERCQVKLNRLQRCVANKDASVSKEFSRMM